MMRLRRDTPIERAAALLLGMVLLLGIAAWVAVELLGAMVQREGWR